MQAPVRARPAGTAAVLIATAAAPGGGPAAAQPWGESTLVGHLLGQLAELGVGDVTVITRPAWADDLGAHVVATADAADDLRALAELAARGGALLVARAEVVAQREALADLLDADTAALTAARDPAAAAGAAPSATGAADDLTAAAGAAPSATGAADDLTAAVVAAPGATGAAGRPAPEGEAAVRVQRARVVAAASGFHRVRRASGVSLGMLKVAPQDAPALAASARRLADLAAQNPELDAVDLLLVGLVRGGAVVRAVDVRARFWARPLTTVGLERAERARAAHDDDRAQLDSAVKADDTFFTTFLVSPYSKHLAHWAARRGFTPDAITLTSFAIGVAAAAAFATGQRAGLVAGAVLLQVAFAADCVDGQLARYTRRFSSRGAWLDSMLDRAKEYAVYAGLALGAGGDVWVLAAGALALLTFRHIVLLAWAQTLPQTLPQPSLEERDDAPAGSTAGAAVDRVPGAVWLRKAIGLPIGERFAVISLTAALGGPRTTFAVLLIWGGVGAAYELAIRLARSWPRGAQARGRGVPVAAGSEPALIAYRDDGPLARALGSVAPPLPPLALVAAGAAPLVVAVAAGADPGRPLRAAIVAWLVLAAGLSGGQVGTGKLRWAVPPALRAAEYGAVLWLAGAAAADAAFALLAVVALRHYDILYRLRDRGTAPPAWLNTLAGGWDGRLLAACVLLLTGALRPGLFALAALIGAAALAEAVASWRRPAEAAR
jgi:phosphatidylglycerophosphate synthase